MKKHIHNKLIRDKDPAAMKRQGTAFKLKKIGIKKQREELKKKLLEESKEVVEVSDKDGIRRELADLSELIQSIARLYKVTPVSIEKLRCEKLKKRGGFKRGNYLVWCSNQAGKWESERKK